jgi:hypothetical protein
MNAGVALVRTYLQMNGYFTVAELPVIRKDSSGEYQEVTDIDILALRFPHAARIVSRGRPGPTDDLTFAIDEKLDIPEECMDLIIGEVKEGKPRINPALRSPDTLYTALVRTGCCPPDELDRVVDELRKKGHARVSADSAGVPCRIRLVAFGDGRGSGRGYTVVTLRQIKRFVIQHLRRYRDILQPVHHGDPVLGLLHLLEKLD